MPVRPRACRVVRKGPTEVGRGKRVGPGVAQAPGPAPGWEKLKSCDAQCSQQDSNSDMQSACPFAWCADFFSFGFSVGTGRELRAPSRDGTAVIVGGGRTALSGHPGPRRRGPEFEENPGPHLGGRSEALRFYAESQRPHQVLLQLACHRDGRRQMVGTLSMLSRSNWNGSCRCG